jgi:hypothetical protein
LFFFSFSLLLFLFLFSPSLHLISSFFLFSIYVVLCTVAPHNHTEYCCTHCMYNTQSNDSKHRKQKQKAQQPTNQSPTYCTTANRPVSREVRTEVPVQGSSSNNWTVIEW